MDKDKILVIDDERLIFESIEDTLGEEYQLYYAENGKRGLQLHQEHHPILIILDIRMPVMDGFEFLQRVQLSVEDSYSVIVLSGHAVGPEVSQCYAMGITAFLRKPFNVFELKGLVKQCVSARKQYHTLLHEKRYIRAILDHSMDMIISLDNQMNIIEFNPATEHALGYSVPEMRAIPFKTIFAEATKFDEVDRVLSNEKTFSGEVFLRRKNGEEFPAYLKLTVLQDASGISMGIVGEIPLLYAGDIVGAVGGMRDMSMEKQLAILQREKRDLEMVRIAAATMKDKVRNRLNGMMMLRHEVEGVSEIDQNAIAYFDASIKDISVFLNKLEEIGQFSTVTFYGSTIFDVEGKYQKKS